LGVKLWYNPITDIVSKLIEVDQESFKESNQVLKGAGLASAHAVLRTVQGLMASHRFGSGIVSTGNHTENILSWFSFHDIGSVGVHALIGDLTKMEIFSMCTYLNERFGNAIPEELLNGVFIPSAELPDSDKDPFDYKVQSGLCAEVIRFRKSKEDLMYEFENKTLSTDLFPYQEHVYAYTKEDFMEQINLTFKLMKRSPYKTGQAAPPVNISPRTRGFSTRETLINKYEY
jgi:NH3-dependent NAD+ synthetase